MTSDFNSSYGAKINLQLSILHFSKIHKLCEIELIHQGENNLDREKAKIVSYSLIVLLICGIIYVFEPGIVRGSYTFSDGFESGNFNQWTSAIGTPTIQSSITNDGTYAIRTSMPTNNYVLETLPSANAHLFARTYMRFTALPTTWTSRSLINFYDSGSNIRLGVSIFNNGGTYQWVLWTGTSHYSTSTINTNQWYSVEAEYAANTNTHHLYIDGNLIITSTDARTENINSVAVGSVSQSTGSGWSTGATGYFDSIVINTNYIGTQTLSYSFSDGFESGNFNQWTSAIGTPTIQSSITNDGTYAIRTSMPTNNYVLETLPSANAHLFARTYMRFTALPTTWTSRSLINFYDSGSNIRLGVSIFNNGGTYQWVLWTGTSHYSTSTINTNQWYSVEAEYAANTNTHHLYIDGNLIITSTDARTENINSVAVGSVSQSTGSGWSTGATGYFDSIVINTNYIGTQIITPAPSPTITPTPTPSPSTSASTPINKATYHYGGINSADYTFVAQHYSIFDIAFGQSQSALQNLKAQNANVKVFGYKLLNSEPSSSDDWNTVNSHEDWFVHDL